MIETSIQILAAGTALAAAFLAGTTVWSVWTMDRDLQGY